LVQVTACGLAKFVTQVLSNLPLTGTLTQTADEGLAPRNDTGTDASIDAGTARSSFAWTTIGGESLLEVGRCLFVCLDCCACCVVLPQLPLAKAATREARRFIASERWRSIRARVPGLSPPPFFSAEFIVVGDFWTDDGLEDVVEGKHYRFSNFPTSRAIEPPTPVMQYLMSVN
jgi:hypothetical protein